MCHGPALKQLIDHFVGAGEQRRRCIEAERLGSFEIDHKLAAFGWIENDVIDR
jgi:hypothetical protein